MLIWGECNPQIYTINSIYLPQLKVKVKHRRNIIKFEYLFEFEAVFKTTVEHESGDEKPGAKSRGTVPVSLEIHVSQISNKSCMYKRQ